MRRVGIGLASLVLAGGLWVGAAPTAEAAPYNSGRIRNKAESDRSLWACKDWSGTKSDPGCKSGTEWELLSRGEVTPKGDWDGYEIPSGCNVGRKKGPKQVKVSGLFGATFNVNLVC